MAVARRAVQSAAPKPVHSSADGVEELSAQVRDLQAVPSPWSKGAVLTFDVSGAGDQTAKHKLGRVPSGWIITRLTASGTDSPVVSERSATDVSITLYFSVACRATVLVY